MPGAVSGSIHFFGGSSPITVCMDLCPSSKPFGPGCLRDVTSAAMLRTSVASNESNTTSTTETSTMPDTTADAGSEGDLTADNLTTDSPTTDSQTTDSQTTSDQELEDLAQQPG